MKTSRRNPHHRYSVCPVYGHQDTLYLGHIEAVMLHLDQQPLGAGVGKQLGNRRASHAQETSHRLLSVERLFPYKIGSHPLSSSNGPLDGYE